VLGVGVVLGGGVWSGFVFGVCVVCFVFVFVVVFVFVCCLWFESRFVVL
jgi:hypothetical protein